MELVIHTPNDGDFIKAIEFNKDAIREYIEANLEKYQNLIYDDYSIKSAKADRATLNNFKKAIEDKRIEIKKKYLEPINAFEADIKELTALVDKPMLAIDAQVKAYEDKKRTKKQEEINLLYEQIFEDFKTVVPLESIQDPKWLNATYKNNQIGAEILETYEGIKTGVKIIKDKQSEFETELLDTYFRTRNLERVLQKEEDLKAVKAAVKVEPPRKPEPYGNTLLKLDPIGQNQPEAAPERKWYDFSLYLSKEEVGDLKEWIRANNVKVRKVE